MIFGRSILFVTHKYLHWLSIMSLVGLFILFCLSTQIKFIRHLIRRHEYPLWLKSLSIIALWCID